jgi:perosamine synthetase
MKVPLFKIYNDKSDVNNITKTIMSGRSWAVGDNISKFEKEISKYIGTKHCVVFNSGTSALHAILLANNIKEGDEVIVPSFTFIATANAVLFVGATPVFADIETDTFGLDPESVKQKITTKTKAIIPVHYGGSPCKINELRKIAKDNNLLLIEDAAEAFGAELNNKKIGTFGDAAMLSFCQNKIITTGDGGAIVTNSVKMYNKLKLIRSHGQKVITTKTPGYLEAFELGYNFRLPDILCSLGLSQIKKTNKLISMRRSNAQYYNKQLSKNKNLILNKDMNKDINKDMNIYKYYHVYQLFTLRVKSKQIRDKLVKFLKSKGISTKVYFYPIHLTKFYRNEYNFVGKELPELPVTKKISDTVLTLPMYPGLTKKEIDYIVKNINLFFKTKR